MRFFWCLAHECLKTAENVFNRKKRIIAFKTDTEFIYRTWIQITDIHHIFFV